MPNSAQSPLAAPVNKILGANKASVRNLLAASTDDLHDAVATGGMHQAANVMQQVLKTPRMVLSSVF